MMTKMTELATYADTLTKALAAGFKCNNELSTVIQTMHAAAGFDKYRKYERIISQLTAGNDEPVQHNAHKVTNRIIYDAYNGFASTEYGTSGIYGDLVLYLPRASGVTTSIQALIKLYPGIEYVQWDGRSTKDDEGYINVIFVEGDAPVVKKTAYTRVIRIKQVDTTL